jgi:hypothetical protein
MRPDPTRPAKTRAPAIALISLAVLGLLMFLLAALAPAYLGVTADDLPSRAFMGLGALMLGLSIVGAVLLALLGLKNHRG